MSRNASPQYPAIFGKGRRLVWALWCSHNLNSSGETTRCGGDRPCGWHGDLGGCLGPQDGRHHVVAGLPRDLWALFKTIDHGRTWGLERQTQPQGRCASSMPAWRVYDVWRRTPPCNFGTPRMGHRLNGFRLHSASVYRPTDGGKTWNLTSARYPPKRTREAGI